MRLLRFKLFTLREALTPKRKSRTSTDHRPMAGSSERQVHYASIDAAVTPESRITGNQVAATTRGNGLSPSQELTRICTIEGMGKRSGQKAKPHPRLIKVMLAEEDEAMSQHCLLRSWRVKHYQLQGNCKQMDMPQ
jgi:hypothetical protein